MRMILLPALVLAAGCSSAEIPSTSAPRPSTRIEMREGIVTLGGNSRTEATRQHIDQAPPTVWPLLLATYNEMGIGVARLDSATFLIGNPELPVRGARFAGELASRTVDCGRTGTGSPIADRYSLTVQIHTQLIPLQDGTEVRSLIVGRALNPTTNDPPVRCVSTGRLEQRIIQALTLRRAGITGS